MSHKKSKERKFYETFDFNKENVKEEDEEEEEENSNSALIRNDLYGGQFEGPFGGRRILYADYVASGKSLKFIEGFISKHVLPFYANTHTASTVTSMQTSMFRDEARLIVRNAVNAAEDDAVIFTGNGTTAAVHKLIHALKPGFKEKVVVFASLMEHHSNLLPWRELPNAKVITVGKLGYACEVHLQCIQVKSTNHG